MSFRDDRDALLARNDALEREVADAKQALAEKERELERVKNPPSPDQEPAEQPPRAERQSVPPSKAQGRALAADLVSGDSARVKASLRELAEAPPIVTDAAAGAIAGYLKNGGAQARAVCEVYIANNPPRLGGSSYHKVLRAFMKASASEELQALAERAMAAHVTLGVDEAYLDKQGTAKAAGASRSFAVRILSVFTRAWVIVMFGMPALFAIMGMITAPSARPIIGAALACYAALVIVLDAYLRRCPSCKRWLAGTFLNVVRDQYDFHITSWSCTFCNRRWQSSRYAGPR